MGITNSNKVIDVNEIDCTGELKVTLALTGCTGYYFQSH